jgi:hypothetical protein
MRGFDYELWEYYSSSADNGWGGWCVESGWTNTWIAATFGLRNLNRGLLCRKNKEHYRHVFAKVYNEMQIVYKEFNKFQSVNIEAPGAE